MRHTLRIMMFMLCPVSLVAANSGHILSEQYTIVRETLRIGSEPNRLINMTERGHTLLVPHKGVTPIGVVVFFQRGKSETAPDSGSFDFEVFERDLAVMHVATANPLDFFFDDTTMEWAATHIQEILETHNMKNIPIFFAGLSLGGTRALRFAAFLSENEMYWLKAFGVVLVDSPLDMERLWKAEKKAANLGFHWAAEDEGR